MDWGTAIPPLIGTVIGGVLTISGQGFADQRKEAAEVKADLRAVFRAKIERQRKNVRDLHDRVGEDIAAIRSETMKADEATNIERAEMLDPICKDVAARHDRAAALIAVVPDSKVRDAADAVYEAWGNWLAGEVSSMVDSQENIISPDGARDSRSRFAAAVRKHLVDLDDTEEAGPPA